MSDGDDLTDCIEACFDCVEACERCLDECCLPMGMAECGRLCRDAADLAGLCARLCIRGSADAALLEACAAHCERCAEECASQDNEHCQTCAEACRRCAETCRAAA